MPLRPEPSARRLRFGLDGMERRSRRCITIEYPRHPATHLLLSGIRAVASDPGYQPLVPILAAWLDLRKLTATDLDQRLPRTMAEWLAAFGSIDIGEADAHP